MDSYTHFPIDSEHLPLFYNLYASMETCAFLEFQIWSFFPQNDLLNLEKWFWLILLWTPTVFKEKKNSTSFCSRYCTYICSALCSNCTKKIWLLNRKSKYAYVVLCIEVCKFASGFQITMSHFSSCSPNSFRVRKTQSFKFHNEIQSSRTNTLLSHIAENSFIEIEIRN